ncbi:GDP-mannose 4,6-dehydratase [Candidatus Babeliales bacterium]|nr:GDP-mannose 4,6-dehydratase [Candidatus Babeliales bacterium]
MSFELQNILVTGAAGLLGPQLITELLKNKANVIAFERDIKCDSFLYKRGLDRRVSVVYGDLSNLDDLVRILNEFDIDVVFHLGAQAIVGRANRSPISTFKSNIEGTWNLLEACRLSPWVKKIIVASSDKAYGEHTNLPYSEDYALRGRYPYDVSKSCADLLAQSYFHTYKLPVCITRCGNFFGGGDLHFNRIVPGTIRALLLNQRPVIRSNGALIRDYIYVKDVVDAYIALALKMDDSAILGHSFNFSTDKSLSVLEIVDMIRQEAGIYLEPIVQNQHNNEILAQNLDSSKAYRMLGWKPRYGIKRGLAETIAWYQDFLGIASDIHAHEQFASEQVK